MTTIVKQRIDGFLQHAFFVTNNHVRRFQLEKIFQTIVAVDDATIEIVQIGSGETTAFERNERTQIRRNDWQNRQNHPFRTSVGSSEALNELDAFGEFLADLLGLGVAHRFFEFLREGREIGQRKKGFNGFCTHAGDEIAFAVLLNRFAILGFCEELSLREWSLTRINNDVVLVINHALQLATAHIEHEADAGRHALVEPDVGNRNGEFDVTHALATNPAQGHFDAATVADHALVFDAFVFTAGTFPVPSRAEDALAEQATFFGLKRAIIDRFGIFHLSTAPRADGIG